MQWMLALFLCLAGAGAMMEAALASSRVVWNDNGQAVVVGRSVDWPQPLATELYALPRGIKRDGMTGANTVTWVSKYGSVVAATGGDEVRTAIDGVNDQGLSAGTLWLALADFGKFDPARKSLSLALWTQYALDNFATVAEAVALAGKDPLQLVGGEFVQGFKLVLADPSGDVAVIEYLDGKPRIHHNRSYTVATSAPPFALQLKALSQYRGFGGKRRLPGPGDAAERFVRGAAYLSALPKPADYREAGAGALSVIRNLSLPLGQPADPKQPATAPTRWRTVADLSNKVYFYESATSPNLIWVRLDDLDLGEGSGIRKLDPVARPDLIGNATEQLESADMFQVPPPDLGVGSRAIK
jgi:penicillin V acylase-like amidase (Ntn superfamily)